MILTSAEIRVVEHALKDYVPTLDGRIMRAQITPNALGDQLARYRAEREAALDVLDRIANETKVR